MNKKLKSGLFVIDKEYYKALDLKDNNPLLFKLFCLNNNIEIESINSFTKEQYDELIKIIK